MTKKEFSAFVNREYDSYEQKGLTVKQVALDVERRLRDAELTVVAPLRGLRNDISTHMGKRGARFDRKLHTHGCGNGCPCF